MSKTSEELNVLKKEVESVSEKLHELTPEELEQVNGGALPLDRTVLLTAIGGALAAPVFGTVEGAEITQSAGQPGATAGIQIR